MDVTTDELELAYDSVTINTIEAQASGLSFEIKKEEVEVKVLKATANGTILGKNEGERKAAALYMFEKDYQELNALELKYKENSNSLALAKIHLDFVRDCIRIMELSKK